MNEHCKQLYQQTQNYFQNRTLAMRELEDSQATLDDCVDAIYAIRESVDYLESIRKDLNKISEKLQQVVCITLLTRHKKSHSTDYCTGVKRMSQSYNIPTKKKDPERYAELMMGLGIPPDVIRQELVRVHWPSFKDYCAELQTKGENPPVGIDPTKGSPVFTVTIRKKKDVLSDD